MLSFRAIRPRALKGHLDKYLGSNNILVLRIDGWVCRYAPLMSSVQNLLLTYLQYATCFKVFDLDKTNSPSSQSLGDPNQSPKDMCSLCWPGQTSQGCSHKGVPGWLRGFAASASQTSPLFHSPQGPQGPQAHTLLGRQTWTTPVAEMVKCSPSFAAVDTVDLVRCSAKKGSGSGFQHLKMVGLANVN